jgi:hypothetical protein
MAYSLAISPPEIATLRRQTLFFLPLSASAAVAPLLGNNDALPQSRRFLLHTKEAE